MIILLILILLLLTLFVYKTSKKDDKYMKNVPGPKPLFLFGNTLDFVLKPTYKWMEVFAKYVDTYGGIVRVHDGPFSEFIMVTDPKFLEHVLSSTRWTTKAYQYDYLHGWLGYGLITSTGNKWKTYRRLLTPAFHFSILENFIEVFNSCGRVFIEKLRNEVNKKSVDISEYIGLYTLDIIAESAMGVKLDAQTNKTSAYVQSTKVMGKIVLSRFFSILHPVLYSFTPDYFKEKRALQVLHNHTDSIIQKRIAERAEADTTQKVVVDGVKKRLAFLDLLLSYTIQGQPLPSLDIREEVDTFLFAGHDTSSSAIAFAMYSLANNPEIQEKAFQEQKDIFEDLKTEKITNGDLLQMKYLELVIKETLRLYPSVPMIGREFPMDEEWNGILYKKGTTIMISPYLLHRNPKHFPEPLKFIPERFENLNLINPYIYIPFSAGPRNCIGQRFAMLEMKSTLSKVLRNFQLLPAIPAHSPQISPDLILSSRNGVRISLLARC